MSAGKGLKYQYSKLVYSNYCATAFLALFRHRDITEEENPYDAVTIEEGDKIYEDLVNIKIKEKVI